MFAQNKSMTPSVSKNEQQNLEELERIIREMEEIAQQEDKVSVSRHNSRQNRVISIIYEDNSGEELDESSEDEEERIEQGLEKVDEIDGNVPSGQVPFEPDSSDESQYEDLMRDELELEKAQETLGDIIVTLAMELKSRKKIRMSRENSRSSTRSSVTRDIETPTPKAEKYDDDDDLKALLVEPIIHEKIIEEKGGDVDVDDDEVFEKPMVKESVIPAQQAGDEQNFEGAEESKEAQIVKKKPEQADEKPKKEKENGTEIKEINSTKGEKHTEILSVEERCLKLKSVVESAQTVEDFQEFKGKVLEAIQILMDDIKDMKKTPSRSAAPPPPPPPPPVVMRNPGKITKIQISSSLDDNSRPTSEVKIRIRDKAKDLKNDMKNELQNTLKKRKNRKSLQAVYKNLN